MRKVGPFTIRDAVLLASTCIVLGVSAGIYVAYGYGTPAGVSSDEMSGHPDLTTSGMHRERCLMGRTSTMRLGGQAAATIPPCGLC